MMGWSHLKALLSGEGGCNHTLRAAMQHLDVATDPVASKEALAATLLALRGGGGDKTNRTNKTNKTNKLCGCGADGASLEAMGIVAPTKGRVAVAGRGGRVGAYIRAPLGAGTLAGEHG